MKKIINMFIVAIIFSTIISCSNCNSSEIELKRISIKEGGANDLYTIVQVDSIEYLAFDRGGIVRITN